MNKEILGLAEQIYQLGYEKGQKDPLMLFKTDYDRGLNDAWECARKLTHPRYGGYRDSEEKEIFGYDNSDDVLTNYSASEAIQKIKEYEEKQKNEFQVGDEVMNPWGRKGYVSCMNDDELFVIYPGGTTGHSTKCTYEKTGRHVPLLAEWLEQMREWVVE
jgi:hypothetical protein